MDYKITIKLDDGLVKEKIDALKKQISGVDGVKKIEFKTDTQSLTDSLSKVGMMLTGLQAGFQITKNTLIALGNAIIKPAADFEALRVRLVNLYQDTDKANQVFEQFKIIAATTPFELRNVVEAGASLKAFGLNAEDTLKSVADLAAFMGVDVVEAASAVGRAFAGGAGAADILRERGVLELIKSFKGIDDLTKLTLPEFRQAMLDTFESPASGIAGATNLLSQTYTGAMSNMKDALTNFSAAIGSNFTPALSITARSITSFIESITPVKTELEKVTDETINQQAEFNSLVSTYKILRFEQNETVKSNTALKDIVDRLNANYKDYIGNIDLATVSYHDFQIAVSKANDELIREAKIKLINAEKSDMISEIAKNEVEYTKSVEKNRKERVRIEGEYAKTIEKQLELNKMLEANKMQSAKTSEAVIKSMQDGYLGRLAKNKEQLENLTNEFHAVRGPLEKELNEFTNKYRDMLSKATASDQSGNDSKSGGVDDKLNKELEALKRSLKEKEALLKEDYQTNQKFILDNVKDKEEQTKLLSALDMKYANEYADLKKSENSQVKSFYQEQQKLHQELQEDKLKADNEYNQQRYAVYEENQKAYDEFLTREYEMSTSAEDRRKSSINAFYNQYKSVLMDMGVAEADIERQRSTRLTQASEGFRGFTSFLESGLDNLWDNINNKSMNTKERWNAVWKSMRATGLKALGDIIKQKILDGVKTMALYKAETVAHAGKETTKTSFSGAGALARIAIATAETAKEIALTIAGGIKYVAVKIWQIGASIMKWFTSIFGPLGIPLAIAGTVGAIAAINSMRKGFAGGGYTGDGGKNEEAGIVHKGEVVLESGIVKNQLPEILKLRSLLQKGYKIKDIVSQPLMNIIPNIMPKQQLAFAGGGYVAGTPSNNGSFFEQLNQVTQQLQILNANVVNKDMTTFINVQTTDNQIKIRKDKITSDKMRIKGEKV